VSLLSNGYNPPPLTQTVSGKWSRDKEKDVIKIRDNLIAMFLLSGKTVILDDTNLSEKTVIRDVWVKNGIFVFNVNQYDLEF